MGLWVIFEVSLQSDLCTLNNYFASLALLNSFTNFQQLKSIQIFKIAYKDFAKQLRVQI